MANLTVNKINVKDEMFTMSQAFNKDWVPEAYNLVGHFNHWGMEKLTLSCTVYNKGLSDKHILTTARISNVRHVMHAIC